MNYRVILKKPAKKFLDRLPPSERARLVSAIEKLPESGNIKKLEGRADIFRLRVGGYRVLYTIDHGALIIYILSAGTRGDVYKHP